MCGLVGYFSTVDVETTRASTERMLCVQKHRGPDSTGIWCGTVRGVNIGLGLNRLKILDLSDAANQPMISTDGRYVLVFNGEIYNYVELRAELCASGAVFRTDGDTEVLLQALIRWGPAAFARLNGMWALAFLDRIAGKVLLSRDRFGIKPLYTYNGDRGLFVASEIKTILEGARTRFEVNTEVANAFLGQNFLCTSEDTFFKGIQEFPAGHWQERTIGEFHGDVNPQRYWTTPTTTSDDLREDRLIDLIRTTFIDSVKLRLRSDVPVGALLSGGMDSSAIAGALHYLNPTRSDLKLISAVEGNGGGEEPFMDAVGTYLNRKVEKVRLDYHPSESLALLSEVSWFNDEPVLNFSTVAHYLLMKRARDLGVTVLLSGQGADEILCGYQKYPVFYVQELLAEKRWLSAGRVVKSFLRAGTVLPQVKYQEAKRYLPHWLRLPEIDVRGPALLHSNNRIRIGLNGKGVIARQVVDLERLSVPALVHYEDRMSMAAAREIRLPFLDYRMVSLLLPLPVEYKLHNGWTKWIFRRAIETLVPKEIAWRKDKRHFVVPQNHWFRSELRGDVMNLLDGEWLTEHLGLVDRRQFRARYNAYLRQPAKGGRFSFKDIFTPIALEMWARRFEPHISRTAW
jgi:asparagine synthase (glutamine-hydrolysing)